MFTLILNFFGAFVFAAGILILLAKCFGGVVSRAIYQIVYKAMCDAIRDNDKFTNE